MAAKTSLTKTGWIATIAGDLAPAIFEVTPMGLIGLRALDPPAEGARPPGYVLTHLPTGRVVGRVKLKRDAREARRRLEGLDWSDLESPALRAAVGEVTNPGGKT